MVSTVLYAFFCNLYTSCLDSDTILPKHWIPLLKNPAKYLCGPNSDDCKQDPQQKIGIVGAGMAGLTMAWLLKSVGHEVINERI